MEVYIGVHTAHRCSSFVLVLFYVFVTSLELIDSEPRGTQPHFREKGNASGGSSADAAGSESSFLHGVRHSGASDRRSRVVWVHLRGVPHAEGWATDCIGNHPYGSKYPLRRCLGWVPGGSKYLLRRYDWIPRG